MISRKELLWQSIGIRRIYKLKIAIRLDDITPDMDWEKFNRFKSILDRNDIKPLIGVVPDNQDSKLTINSKRPDFWSYIKKLQREGWIVAMHGVNHVYKTKRMGEFPLNQLSEFAGLVYEEQYNKLKAGQNILKENGIDTDIFMAPAHSFDKNTLKALEKLSFDKITDGFGNKPYEYKSFTYYPISFKQSSSLKKKNGYTTFVFHVNTMNDKDFEKYEALFEKRKSDFISYKDYLEITPKRKNGFSKLIEKMQAYIKFVLVQKL